MSHSKDPKATQPTPRNDKMILLIFSTLFFTLARSLSIPAAAVAAGKGTIVVGGSTGYIGKSVVRESSRQGYRTIALVRDVAKARSPLYDGFLNAPFVELVQCDVTSQSSIESVLGSLPTPPVSFVSCLASRSGTKKDSYMIDYGASSNLLKAAQATISSSSSSSSAPHYVLLSAFCCKNPWLQFQQAKLKFEGELISQNDLSYSIVRPTAFFKSVSGQLEVVQKGAPFVMFGDGKVTSCNPIAEADLATYLIDCVSNIGRHKRIINLGGPDLPLTMKRQGEMLFKSVGKEENFFYAPLWLFDVIIDSLQYFGDWFKSEKLQDAAELGRIGKYYAVEDMLTTDPEEKFGTMTLQEHYDKIAEFGQDFDPYTTMFASAPKKVAAAAAAEAEAEAEANGDNYDLLNRAELVDLASGGKLTGVNGNSKNVDIIAALRKSIKVEDL